MMRRMDLNGNRCISFEEFFEAIMPTETIINDQPFRNSTPRAKPKRTKNGSPIGPERSPLRSEYDVPASRSLKQKKPAINFTDSPARSTLRNKSHLNEEASKVVTFQPERHAKSAAKSIRGPANLQSTYVAAKGLWLDKQGRGHWKKLMVCKYEQKSESF